LLKRAQSLEAYGLLLVNLLVHLPFLWAGYGKEEDAWSNLLNARIIAETGVYEVSRLPGHPLYELLLSKLYPLSHAPWLFNGVSALASALVVFYTYQSMKKLALPHAFWTSLGLSFIPVFFIAGTYTIDYNLALALIMASFYAQLNHRWLWAGLLLGLATGVRISSLGFLLPWIIWMAYHKADITAFGRLLLAALFTAALAFSLPYLTYGWAFLDFHKPPFPGIANVLYKLSLGIFGLPLLLYFAWLKWKVRAKWKAALLTNKPLAFTLILAFLMQLLVFLRLPFKAEFFIPALPFAVMLFALVMNRVQARAFAAFAALSCCIMGFDYHSVRGATGSPLAVDFKAGGKTIQFDLLQGPVFLDQSKRRQKTFFVQQVAAWTQNQSYPYWLIAGWYWPELVYALPAEATQNIDYLSTAEELLEASAQGKEIYYLPEINEANAKVYEHYLADSLGIEWKPLP
jgi:hypothetical protein